VGVLHVRAFNVLACHSGSEAAKSRMSRTSGPARATVHCTPAHTCAHLRIVHLTGRFCASRPCRSTAADARGYRTEQCPSRPVEELDVARYEFTSYDEPICIVHAADPSVTPVTSGED
jgi:hypothetical protein